MTTLRTYLDKGSLWGEIETIENFPFIGGDSQFLDTLQKIEYGDRVLSPAFENVEINFAAKAIVKLFSTKWGLLIDAETDKINIMGNSTKLIETENSQTKLDVTDTETVNKVSSYNDDSLLVDTGSNNTNNNNQTLSSNGKVSESEINYKNLFNNLNSVEQSNIINIVLLDVSKYLTLQLY